jgi:hypothetical protein
MTLSTSLGVLGIVATIVFGVWGILVVIRRRYPGEVCLVISDCIGLFDAIVKNFPDLSVLYKNKPVSHGLVLVKGTFINSGRKDITPNMVEQKLSLALPKDFRWLAAKIIDVSENVTADIAVEPEQLLFTTGLLRCREYFRFEAIAEVPIAEPGNFSQSIESHLIAGLNPDHRIADVGKIRTIYLPLERNIKWRFRHRLIAPSAMIAIAIVLYTILFWIGFPAKTNFMMPQSDGKLIEVSVKPRCDGSIRIRSMDNTVDDRMPAQQFFSRNDIEVKIVPDPRFKIIIAIIFFGYIVVPIGMIIFAYCKQKKWLSLHEQIGLCRRPQ